MSPELAARCSRFPRPATNRWKNRPTNLLCQPLHLRAPRTQNYRHRLEKTLRDGVPLRVAELCCRFPSLDPVTRSLALKDFPKMFLFFFRQLQTYRNFFYVSGRQMKSSLFQFGYVRDLDQHLIGELVQRYSALNPPRP